ncbi:MAG: glycoside hydrolase family 31 protein [Spirochaetes bacterium]|nr:glycoside hydrolase family 31 protein [Spirochaetota bacterium]
MFALEKSNESVVLQNGKQSLRISFVTGSTARITFTEDKPFGVKPSFIVTTSSTYNNYRITENAGSISIATEAMKIAVDRQTGAMSFFDSSGRLLMREPERGGKWLTPKAVYRNVYRKDAAVAAGMSIDGVRAVAGESERVFDRHAFEAKLEFVFSENEALFGLGSHEEGYGNLRGKSRDLYQQNMKAVVPYFVSTKGYGILVDCSSLMTFHDDAYGSYIWADVVDELDYYFIQGDRFDDITRGYHELTGGAPMLPKWAFGYVQSKERYVNAREMTDVVREYRRREIPLDLIVLDWKSWPAGDAWGQKSFDPERFPDPKGFTQELHDMHAKLMVSIWPIMTGNCPDQRELLDRGLMLGNQSTYNAFDDDARRIYWEQANRGLFSNGVDSWWCDCSEPFEADWTGAVKPEPHERLTINTRQSKQYIDEGLINAYSLFHARGIYEGQRKVSGKKRVINLTRSSYAGQHRYATVTWSGDISATWETLRRSIPEGVNFCAAGEPYWSLDIGGFFIKNDPKLWFWRGDYDNGCRGLTDASITEPDPKDNGCTDLGYWELYTRWMHYGVFLPMFRSHGTDAPREIWRFGEPGTPFYDAIAASIRLRYRLIPYIYSLAAQVTLSSYTMLRAVALDFPDDATTHDLIDQFLFGPAFMVCPVCSPMYYLRNSEPIRDSVKRRDVYLPRGRRWYDFWTDEVYEGGQTVSADAPLEKIPVFVPAGSIIPMSPVMQYVDAIPDAPYEIRVYRGADAEFNLYEDAGDSYGYENGEYAMVKLSWHDAAGELVIAERTGGFSMLVKSREYQIVFISAQGRKTRTVRYTGQEFRTCV